MSDVDDVSERCNEPIAIAQWQLNEEYFLTFYENFIAYRTRYRKNAIPISILLIIVGAVLMVAPEGRFVGGVLLAIGALDALETCTHRWRWMRHAKRLQQVEEGCFEFFESYINKPTGITRGQIDYEAFDDYTQASDGFFLRMVKGFSIFVPNASIEPQSKVESIHELLRNKVDPKQSA